MKKLLKQILSELQGIRKALEPEEEKPNPMDDIDNTYIPLTTVLPTGTAAEQKPEFTIKPDWRVYHKLGHFLHRGTFEECEQWIADQKPLSDDDDYCNCTNEEVTLLELMTVCGRCHKQIQQEEESDQKPKLTTINHGIYDTTTQKCVYTDTKEACEQWIADQLDADQLEAEQKPKLPESVDDLADRSYCSVYVPTETLESFSAMSALYVLRKAYWQAEDWEPELDIHVKDVIVFAHHPGQTEQPVISQSLAARRFLTFKAGTGQAEHFLKHHRALIEQARELL